MRILSWIRRHPDACVILLYALLSVVLTYPLILNIAHAVPGHGADDPYLAWNIWWAKWSLFDQTANPLFSNYIFYPIGVNLGTYTLSLLNGVLSIPLQLAWDVIPANNLLVFVSITFAAFGAYLLALEHLDHNNAAARPGALVAGLVYGFASYRFAYLYRGHFNFNSNEWLPYYFLFFLRIFNRRGGLTSGMMAGLFFVFTGWTETTFAAFLLVVSACYVLFRLIVNRLRLWSRSAFLGLLALSAVAVTGLSPLLVAVGSDLARYGDFLLRGSGGAEFLSADLFSFFIPSQHNLWLGFLSSNLSYHNMDFAFVGYITFLLAFVGFLATSKRFELAFWGLTALLAAWIMLGPLLHVANQPVPDFSLLPFRIQQSIPLLRANRLPVRYDHLLMLALAILAGAGASTVLSRYRNAKLLFVLVPALVVAEHISVPVSLSDLSAPAIYGRIAADPGDFSVLDLPLSWSSSTQIQGKLYTQSQFYQTVHHKRLLGGNTSRPTPFEFQYFNELPIVHTIIRLENGETIDDASLAEDVLVAPELVRFFDLRYVIARLDQTDPAVLDYVKRVFPLTQISNEDGVVAFRVAPSAESSLTIDHTEALSRLYFGEDWGRAQAGADGRAFRWATSSRAVLYAPLSPTDYEVCGSLAGAQDGQTVRLLANDLPFGEITLTTAWTQHCVALPASFLHAGINLITFESPVFALDSLAFSKDLHIGDTGLTSPADIAVTSAGFFAGKFASLTFRGREVYETKRGFYLMAIDPHGPEPASVQVFDTFRDETESARLAEFIRRLPPGTIVVGAVCDEASRHLTLEAIEALRSVGASTDLGGQFRSSYALIGAKGAPPGSAIQDSNPTFPANISVGIDVTTPNVSIALGTIQFSPLVK